MKILLEKGQNLFFTSDTHYSHSNICKATTNWGEGNLTRDFSSLEHMNNVIVDNINETVGENDILFHLGDWSFGGFDNITEFRNKLNCKNIHLLLGNHDHHIERNKDNIQRLFTSINQYINLDIRRPNKAAIDKYKLILMHFPIVSWDGMNEGIIHLHGHVHLPKHQKINGCRAIDVGIDGNDFEPYSLDNILALLENQPIKRLSLSKDHHELALSTIG